MGDQKSYDIGWSVRAIFSNVQCESRSWSKWIHMGQIWTIIVQGSSWMGDIMRIHRCLFFLSYPEMLYWLMKICIRIKPGVV